DAAGLPSLGESTTWIGLLAPAGTSEAIVDKIQREVAAIYADPAIMAKLQNAGLFAVSSSPAEFRAFIRQETERWSRVIRENPGIRAD
ncbi:MAG TPA: tripartite tricarboxylate transporter substrate-binding protein, partial [Xanthobacteraceae bacterium]|nr:tripartite tricarboxylate transporter substrate-binding protein [Xanthobacteraceae bacterium]